jgi:hypothetical protein
VVVDEYPVYAAPRIYAAPPVYAYAGPVWRNGWGHRGLSAAVGEVSDMQGSTRGYFPTPDCDVRFGSKADIPPQKVMSALPPKADICSALAHVRYGPNTDIALFDHLVGAGEQRGRKT